MIDDLPKLGSKCQIDPDGQSADSFGFNLVRYIVKITLSATKQRYVRPGGRQTQSDGPAEPAVCKETSVPGMSWPFSSPYVAEQVELLANMPETMINSKAMHDLG